MISCASDLILGTGDALKAVMSSEARSGSDSSVRNIRGSWMSATFVCPVVLSIGVQETIGNLKGGIARVEGCDSNPHGYRSWCLRCHGSRCVMTHV